jgi:uncharacterized membrane protein
MSNGPRPRLGLFGGTASKRHVGPADRRMAIGIAPLISVPALRVALTTAVFLVERDDLFAVISGGVLAIIALGFLLGTSGVR